MADAVTVGTKLTRAMIEEIDHLVEDGTYVSRSEALRDAARLLIRTYRGSLKGKVARKELSDKERESALKDFAKRRGLRL